MNDFVQLAIYPLKGHGALLIFVGAALCAVPYALLAHDAMSFSKFGVVSAIVVFGLLCAYLLEVARVTVNGDSDGPVMPELGEEWMDYLEPAGLLLGLLVICAAPALLLAWAGVESAFLMTTALVLGACYFPMGLLTQAAGGSGDMLSPLIVVPSMVRMGAGYLIAVVPVIIVVFAAPWIHGAFTRSPWIGGYLLGVTSLYLLTIQSRLVGLLYRAYEDELDWFA